MTFLNFSRETSEEMENPRAYTPYVPSDNQLVRSRLTNLTFFRQPEHRELLGLPKAQNIGALIERPEQDTLREQNDVEDNTFIGTTVIHAVSESSSSTFSSSSSSSSEKSTLGLGISRPEISPTREILNVPESQGSKSTLGSLVSRSVTNLTKIASEASFRLRNSQVVSMILRRRRERDMHTPSNHSLQHRLTTDKHLLKEALTRRRSAWGQQSIAITATIMTRRNMWLNSRKRRPILYTVFEKYQQNIEDMFGSSVACFFEFIRGLLTMNICLMVIWCAFVAIPQAVAFDYSAVNKPFAFIHLLDGKGMLGESWFFFGNYDRHIGPYQLWFSYLVCMLFTVYFSLFWLVRGISIAIQEEGGIHVFQNYTFSYLSFTAWDYSLKNVQATDTLSLGIANSFRDLISDIQLKNLLKSLRTVDRTKLYICRAFAWALTMCIIGGGCTIIFIVATSDVLPVFRKWGYKTISENNLLVTFTPTAVFTMVNLLVPLIINELPRIEGYIQPQTEMYISIVRVFFLTMSNSVSLVLSQRQKMKLKRFHGCGGTMFGQEMYKQILLDTIVSAISSPCVYIAYYLYFKDKMEFFMPTIVLKIIQTQVIIWLGCTACPMITIYGCLYMVIMFFAYYNVITRLCKPYSKRWLQPHRNIFFLIMTGIALLIQTIAFISVNSWEHYFLYSKVVGDFGNSSTAMENQMCGPFTLSIDTPVIEQFVKNIQQDSIMVGRFFFIVTSPIFVMTFIFIMGAVIYLLIARVRWEIERRLVLLAEVELERLQSRTRTQHPVTMHHMEPLHRTDRISQVSSALQR